MPPRGTGRGAGRGAANRGPANVGGRGAASGGIQVGIPNSSQHITTIGVKVVSPQRTVLWAHLVRPSAQTLDRAVILHPSLSTRLRQPFLTVLSTTTMVRFFLPVSLTSFHHCPLSWSVRTRHALASSAYPYPQLFRLRKRFYRLE